MNNFEKIKNMTKEELAKEIRLIAGWDRKHFRKAEKIGDNFYLDWLNAESKDLKNEINMKLFIINTEHNKWDYPSSVVVLAKNKEKAIELATRYNEFFINNIGEIEEIDLTEEGVIHDHVLYG